MTRAGICIGMMIPVDRYAPTVAVRLRYMPPETSHHVLSPRSFRACRGILGGDVAITKSASPPKIPRLTLGMTRAGICIGMMIPVDRYAPTVAVRLRYMPPETSHHVLSPRSFRACRGILGGDVAITKSASPPKIPRLTLGMTRAELCIDMVVTSVGVRNRQSYSAMCMPTPYKKGLRRSPFLR